MTKPRVLNKFEKLPRDDLEVVYIGRPSKWGNPFYMHTEADRRYVLTKYQQWLDEHPELKEQARQELRGKHLICFCAPRKCHGDILLKVANTDVP